MTRRVARSLIAVSVLGTLGAGCASHDRPAGRTAPDDCSSRIGEQVASGEIPRSDREYFIGMCQENG